MRDCHRFIILQNSFTDIARLLSDFFRDLDVVPSDVVAGLVLLRKFQKIERELIVRQRKDDAYEFMSGVAITPSTKFLSLTEEADFEQFQFAVHYMHFALAAYGWPLFLVNHTTGLCQLCTRYDDASCAFISSRADASYFFLFFLPRRNETVFWVKIVCVENDAALFIVLLSHFK